MLIFLDNETALSPILLGHRTVFIDSLPKLKQHFFVKKVRSGFEELYTF